MKDIELLRSFYKKFKLKYFWIFLTEKCNLNCFYCFYKYKDNSTTISITDFNKIMEVLTIEQDSEFIISGGEPLVEFPLVEKIIKKIRKHYKNNYLLLQTNGILVNRDIVQVLRKYHVNVEIGLDGDFYSNRNSRNGTTKQNYIKMLNAIELLKGHGIAFSCTMTVHPKEAEKMFDNYLFLLGKDFRSIEITPAAFENWNRQTVLIFKKEYLKCLKHSLEKKLKKQLSAEYDKIIKPSADAVITAHGDVLPNWSLLSLPPDKKRKYSLFGSRRGRIDVNRAKIENYNRLYGHFYSKNRTYREYSTLNAKGVYKELNRKIYNAYKEMNNFLKRINTKYLLR